MELPFMDPILTMDVRELQQLASRLPLESIQACPPPVVEYVIPEEHTPMWAQTSVVIPAFQLPPPAMEQWIQPITKRKRTRYPTVAALKKPRVSEITQPTRWIAKPKTNPTLLKEKFKFDDTLPGLDDLRKAFPHFDKTKLRSLYGSGWRMRERGKYFTGQKPSKNINVQILRYNFLADDVLPRTVELREMFPDFSKNEIAALSAAARHLYISGEYFTKPKSNVALLKKHFKKNDPVPSYDDLQKAFPRLSARKIQSLHLVSGRLHSKGLFFTDRKRHENVALLKRHFKPDDPVPSITSLRKIFPQSNKTELHRILGTARRLRRDKEYFVPT